jgi:Leucine-rich repeat (LRR) protein
MENKNKMENEIENENEIDNETILDLNNHNLRVLPKEIGLLTNLKYLNLSHNLIEEIPNEVIIQFLLYSFSFKRHTLFFCCNFKEVNILKININ